MAGWPYIPKAALIYTVTLPASKAWTEILTAAQAKAIRGVKIKPRYTFGQTTQKPFDVAFSETPDTGKNVSDGTGFFSNTGSGFGDVFAPSSGLWARSGTGAAIVLEIITYL